MYSTGVLTVDSAPCEVGKSALLASGVLHCVLAVRGVAHFDVLAADVSSSGLVIVGFIPAFMPFGRTTGLTILGPPRGITLGVRAGDLCGIGGAGGCSSIVGV